MRVTGFLFATAALAAALILITFLRSGEQTSGRPANPEEGLSDSERRSLHATAVAQSGVQLRAARLEFAKSGLSLDGLPQYEIQSLGRAGTADPVASMQASDVVLLVESLGAYVDTGTGEMRLKLRVVEAIKGDAGPTLEVALAGGPERLPDGTWVLGIAPYELFLKTGEMAILPLQRLDRSLFVQRGFEAMLVEDGRIASRERFIFDATLSGLSVDEARTKLAEWAD